MKDLFSPDALRPFVLLRELDDDTLRRVLQSCRPAHYEKRDTVITKGRDFDYLGFLVRGKLQVVDYLPDGTEYGLNLIEEGQFFGELAIIDKRPRSASVVALARSSVLQMPGEVARELIYRQPRVAEAMMLHLVQAVRRMSDLRALQAIPDAHRRVFALVHHLMREDAGGLHVIENLPTHGTMAIMVNTSRETVTRALARLAADGVVQKDLRRLIIRQPQRLHQLTETLSGPH